MEKRHRRFNGDKKAGRSILSGLEKRFIKKFTPKIPSFIETYHLTYLTLFWSLGIILFGYLARNDIRWLWGISILIFFQWLSDIFDGAVGRYRNTGLIRWGYYMDHFLDYVFICSVLIGYSFIIPDDLKYLFFFVFALFVAFMMNSYLYFATTNELRIYFFGFGPTEMRLIFIIINTLLIFFGKSYLAWSLPYVIVAAVIGLTIVVYHCQKTLWKEDMRNKSKGFHKNSAHTKRFR